MVDAKIQLEAAKLQIAHLTEALKISEENSEQSRKEFASKSDM